MKFNFDLISDLHVESWPDTFDWMHQPTSPYCIVAGDISRNRSTVIQTLEHLSECYQGVFYIDGNDEHRNHMDSLSLSYKSLNDSINTIPNTVYLQDNLVVINGVAIIASNGWWTYDFDPSIDHDRVVEWFCEYTQVSQDLAASLVKVAYHDVAYLLNCIRRVQKHQDIKSVIVVTHTVPLPLLVEHDIDLSKSPRYNCLGNEMMNMVLKEDILHKIHTWCFGHYHKPVDRIVGGVRYVNNCKGRGGTPWSQAAYYPKRITIDF